MEISEVVNTQLAFPGLVVGLVLICAVLVFVFGFKSVEDFPFDKLATVADDRKPAGKKRKIKDKKSQSNGQATVVSETKQKSSEISSSKVATSKSKQVEKSPSKDESKSSGKQEKKQSKIETPVKTALKDTKNIKETNKISEVGQKQGKTKDIAGKFQKDQQLNKQIKIKGKENVEIKNKKNAEKSKSKSEEKPKDFDEGEWEQAFSRKDKKNRKPTTSDDDNIAEKSVKTEATSPGKKKKSKPTTEPVSTPEFEFSPPSAAVASPAVDEIPESVKDKSTKKDKEQKKDKPKSVEEATVIDNSTTNVELESDGKKKKKKKPLTKENTDLADLALEEKSTAAETDSCKSKTAESKQAEEPLAQSTAVAFDELGDTWKEAKTQKKASKKKVRKAE